MNFTDYGLNISFNYMGILAGVILILAVVSAMRILIGPTLWDRLLGLNMVSSKLIILIVLLAVIRNQVMLLDVAIVYALLGFIGVSFLAISLQRKAE